MKTRLLLIVTLELLVTPSLSAMTLAANFPSITGEEWAKGCDSRSLFEVEKCRIAFDQTLAGVVGGVSYAASSLVILSEEARLGRKTTNDERIAAVAHLIQIKGDRLFCEGPKVSQTDLRETVLRLIDKDPEVRGQGLPYAIMKALPPAYPCQ